MKKTTLPIGLIDGLANKILKMALKSISILLNPELPVPVVNKWQFVWITDSITESTVLLVKGFDVKQSSKTFEGRCPCALDFFGVQLNAEIIGHEVVITLNGQ